MTDNSIMKDIGNVGMIGLGKMGMPMARLANAARAGSCFLEI
jgi:UDP-N-acetyl-D-mannosaminuronate dehydrogenase